MFIEEWWQPSPTRDVYWEVWKRTIEYFMHFLSQRRDKLQRLHSQILDLYSDMNITMIEIWIISWATWTPDSLIGHALLVTSVVQFTLYSSNKYFVGQKTKSKFLYPWYIMTPLMTLFTPAPPINSQLAVPSLEPTTLPSQKWLGNRL